MALMQFPRDIKCTCGELYFSHPQQIPDIYLLPMLTLNKIISSLCPVDRANFIRAATIYLQVKEKFHYFCKAPCPGYCSDWCQCSIHAPLMDNIITLGLWPDPS